VRFHYDTSYLDAQRLLRYRNDILAYGALALGLLAAPWILPAFYVGELSYLFVITIASIGLMILKGYTGQVSLGHAAFLAIGAYAHAWLLTNAIPWLASLLSAMAISGAFGLVIGLPAIRVSGLYLAMVTLAFSIVVEHVVGRWKSVTGGHNGLPVPDIAIFGYTASGLRPFYYVTLCSLAIILLAAINLVRSRTGRAFIGIRDSEAAAYGLGIWVGGYKVLAFAISAAITGLSGALLAHHVRYLTPDGFSLILSMELVLMVVIGGLGSLRGAVLGAILIGLLPTAIAKLKPVLPTAISAQFGLEIFLFGLILALFVLFEPMGLNGRWLKFKALVTTFPLYRKNTFKRARSYMRSERYR
jgi:branched-chain amino acid transport system permease protein